MASSESSGRRGLAAVIALCALVVVACIAAITVVTYEQENPSRETLSGDDALKVRSLIYACAELTV